MLLYRAQVVFGVKMAESDKLCVTSQIHMNLTASSIVGKVIVGRSPLSLRAALVSLKSRVLSLVSQLRLIRIP